MFCHISYHIIFVYFIFWVKSSSQQADKSLEMNFTLFKLKSVFLLSFPLSDHVNMQQHRIFLVDYKNVANMHILWALFYPLRLWQVCSLSPFGLTQKTLCPNESAKLKFFAIFSLLLHTVVSISGLIFKSSYTDEEDQPIVAFNEIFSLFVSRLLVCVMLIESFLKRKSQIYFFELMRKVDFILKYKLQIKIDYKKIRYQNNTGLVIRIFIYLGFELLVTVTAYTQQNYTFVRLWLYHAIPMLISSLFCHQVGLTFEAIRLVIQCRYFC